MAWQFGDSFNYYNSSPGLSRKWDDVHNTVSISSAGGRSGTDGAFCSGAGTNGWLTKSMTSNVVTGAIGVAVKFSASTAAQRFSWVFDGGPAVIQVALDRAADGSIKVYRGGVSDAASGTLLGSTAPGVLATANVYYYVEWKVKIDASTGTVEIRVNGNSTPVLNLTGLNTRNSANSYYTQATVGVGDTGGISVTVDDVYMIDTTGGSLNDFLGDIHYETPAPDGDGGVVNFTPSAGSNWQNVDETPPDDDTTYNSSTTVGHKDRYTFAAMVATTGSIIAVIVNTIDRKDDSGSRTHSHLSYLSGTEVEGAAWNPGTGYANHQTAFATKPGGGAWTIADVNNAEFGMKIAA